MNLTELYRDEVRASSAELDFGVDWLEAPGGEHVPARVAYIFATGEVYLADRRGVVEILATFPVERCRGCAGAGCDRCVDTGFARDRVEIALEGWETHVAGPYGVRWLRRRLRAWSVPVGAEAAA